MPCCATTPRHCRPVQSPTADTARQTDGGGVARALRDHSRRPGPGTRAVGLDAAGALSRDRNALQQELPSRRALARGAPARVFAPEGAPAPSAVGSSGAGGVQKGGLLAAVNAAGAAHPDKRITSWSEDEARIGQKGRVC